MKRASIAIVGLVLVTAVAGVVVARRKPEAAETPVLLVEPRGAPALEGSKERAMALVVASLSPEERARAIEIMSYASARLEARATSLVVDFGDDIDPMTELQKALSPYLPSITAARALERGHFLGSDFVVTPAASCAPASMCIATWKPAAASTNEPAIAERARFAAWPIAYATVAEFANVAARDNAARSLRATTLSPAAIHALVLTAENLALAPNEQHEELEAAAKRLGIAMDVNNLHESAQLEGLARPAPPGRVAPWLTLSSTELLVVPRLSTVARASELRAAIEHAGGPVVRYRGLATAGNSPPTRP